MSAVRPELARWAMRRREAIAWGALTAFGVWILWRSVSPFAPVMVLLGGLVTLIGAALLSAEIRRLALSAGGPAEGLVEIDEGRISYFGPHGGGFIDVRAVTRVAVTTRPRLMSGPAHAWVLSTEDGARLTIPVGAHGADRLPDALSPLPGLDMRAAVAELGRRHPGEAVVWSRQRRLGRD